MRAGQRLVSGHSYYDTDALEHVFQSTYSRNYAMIDTAAHKDVVKVGARQCNFAGFLMLDTAGVL